MGSKKIRPITPGMRGHVTGDFSEITKSKPEKNFYNQKSQPVVETIKEELHLDTEVVDINKNIE